MTFDTRQFERLQIEHRTKDLILPSLSLIDELWGNCPNEERVWTVRSLTTIEVYKANEALYQRGSYEAIIEVLANQFSNKKEKVDSLKAVLGLDDEISAEFARDIERFVLGSVNPKITIDIATKIAKFFPYDFVAIKNAIYDLSTAGGIIKKSKPSTVQKK